MPQSAYAKLYFHTHPTDHRFPFLYYFLIERVRFLLFIISFLLWVLSIAEFIWKKDRQLLVYNLFGSVFFSILLLYYFFNPGERMIWYFAMPELFLIIHILFAVYHFTVSCIAGKSSTVLLLVFFLFFSNTEWRRTLKSFQLLLSYEKVVEKEGTRIGNHLAAISTRQDTLMAGHGLPARKFQGHVIDISGLNSRLATNYRLNIDSLAADFRPTFIIYHSFPDLLKISNKHSYQLLGLYRDVTLHNYPAWALLKQLPNNVPLRLNVMDTSLNAGLYTMRGQVVSLASSLSGDILLKDKYTAPEKILHAGIKKETPAALINFIIYKAGFVPDSGQLQYKPTDSISRYVFDISVNISGADSIVFSTKNNSRFELTDPIYELRWPKQ